MTADHNPTRMCISCRERQPKNELIRVVLTNQRLAVDVGKIAAGRGAYVHPRAECIDVASSRRMFAKAFRQSVSDRDLAELLNEFTKTTTVEPKPTGVIMSAVQGTHA